MAAPLTSLATASVLECHLCVYSSMGLPFIFARSCRVAPAHNVVYLQDSIASVLGETINHILGST